MEEQDNLSLLNQKHRMLMTKYINNKWDDATLDEIHRVSNAIANISVVSKMVDGSTTAIVEFSKMNKMRHQQLENSKNELSLEELEILKRKRELYAMDHGYRDAKEIFGGVMKGEITPTLGKELIELHHLIVSDEIMKKLEELEAKL